MRSILVRYYKPVGWLKYLPTRWLYTINWWSDIIERRVVIDNNAPLSEILVCVKEYFKYIIPDNAKIGLMFIEPTLDSWNQPYECIKDTRYVDYEGSFILYIE